MDVLERIYLCFGYAALGHLCGMHQHVPADCGNLRAGSEPKLYVKDDSYEWKLGEGCNGKDSGVRFLSERVYRDCGTRRRRNHQHRRCDSLRYRDWSVL